MDTINENIIPEDTDKFTQEQLDLWEAEYEKFAEVRHLKAIVRDVMQTLPIDVIPESRVLYKEYDKLLSILDKYDPHLNLKQLLSMIIIQIKTSGTYDIPPHVLVIVLYSYIERQVLYYLSSSKGLFNITSLFLDFLKESGLDEVPQFRRFNMEIIQKDINTITDVITHLSSSILEEDNKANKIKGNKSVRSKSAKKVKSTEKAEFLKELGI